MSTSALSLLSTVKAYISAVEVPTICSTKTWMTGKPVDCAGASRGRVKQCSKSASWQAIIDEWETYLKRCRCPWRHYREWPPPKADSLIKTFIWKKKQATDCCDSITTSHRITSCTQITRLPIATEFHSVHKWLDYQQPQNFVAYTSDSTANIHRIAYTTDSTTNNHRITTE